MKLLLCLILQLATKSAAIHASTQGLDTVDSMAFSAMRFCELSTANPNRGQGNSDLVAALVADGTSIAGLESDIRVPDGEKVNMYSNDFSSQHWEELYRTLCDFHDYGSRCCQLPGGVSGACLCFYHGRLASVVMQLGRRLVTQRTQAKPPWNVPSCPFLRWLCFPSPANIVMTQH